MTNTNTARFQSATRPRFILDTECRLLLALGAASLGIFALAIKLAVGA